MLSETGLPSVRPWRTPAVTSARSDSIFMRPPRPWPSWRRARSRSMSSGRSSRPAGSPSTTAVSPGPCDSPAVVKRSAIAPQPYRRSAQALVRLLLLDGHAGAVDEDGRERGQRRRVRSCGDAGAGGRGRLALLRARRRGRRRCRAAAEVLALDVEQVEVVADAAVQRAEVLLVARIGHRERDELAGVRADALALALGVEARVADEEQRGLVVGAEPEEDDDRGLLVGEQRVGRLGLEGRGLLAGLAEAEVRHVVEPLGRLRGVAGGAAGRRAATAGAGRAARAGAAARAAADAAGRRAAGRATARGRGRSGARRAARRLRQVLHRLERVLLAGAE